MDALTSITSTTGVRSQITSDASRAGTVDYDAFLTLLVAQLKNQDPTEPTDNAQLMSQLASFSSVEQQVQTNEKLDSLLNNNILQGATGLIGKTLVSSDGATTGTVNAVTFDGSGVIAELEDGQKLAVTDGVTIRTAE